MIRRTLPLALLALALLAGGCRSSDPAAPVVTDHLGAWVPIPDSSDGDLVSYRRVDELAGSTPGIEFRADGTAAERTAGWCGTPPLSYFNVEGTWTSAEAGVVLTDIDLGWLPPRSRWEIESIVDDVMLCRRTRCDETR